MRRNTVVEKTFLLELLFSSQCSSLSPLLSCSSLLCPTAHCTTFTSLARPLTMSFLQQASCPSRCSLSLSNSSASLTWCSETEEEEEQEELGGQEGGQVLGREQDVEEGLGFPEPCTSPELLSSDGGFRTEELSLPSLEEEGREIRRSYERFDIPCKGKDFTDVTLAGGEEQGDLGEGVKQPFSGLTSAMVELERYFHQPRR